MALSPTTIIEVVSILEGMSRKIWHLPINFPRVGLHAPTEELWLNIPTILEDYCGSAIRSRTPILDDDGALGVIARLSLRLATMKLKN
jgi:hypothetical protein